MINVVGGEKNPTPDNDLHEVMNINHIYNPLNTMIRTKMIIMIWWCCHDDDNDDNDGDVDDDVNY